MWHEVRTLIEKLIGRRAVRWYLGVTLVLTLLSAAMNWLLVPGAIAGLALWCGPRVGMRVVAVAAGIPPSFSVSGTLEVLLIGVVLGASYGALLTAVWQSIDATRQAPGRWGGVALALWFWYPFFLAAEGNLSGMVAAPLIVLFTTVLSGMWIAYGVLLATLMRRWGSFPVPI